MSDLSELQPDRYVQVTFSLWILEQMKNWTGPVQMRAEKQDNGEWHIIVHRLNAFSAEAVFTQVMEFTEA